MTWYLDKHMDNFAIASRACMKTVKDECPHLSDMSLRPRSIPLLHKPNTWYDNSIILTKFIQWSKIEINPILNVKINP
jgi:hypothetical protein